MDQRTCMITDCDSPAMARQVCSRHYQQARKAGRLDELPDAQGGAGWHRLSDVDREARTATCSQCGQVSIRIRGKKHGAECMTKRKADRKQYRATPPYSPDGYRRWKYGLTQKELDSLLAESSGRCLICDVDTEGEYHVDHCHETGVVRGILCRRCNYALGWFNDDPARVLAAHLYLIARGKPA